MSEKMNVKAQAHIHSLGGQLAEVTIIERRGDNEFVALYKGQRCSAFFNYFNWSYYVDDIYGIINQ